MEPGAPALSSSQEIEDSDDSAAQRMLNRSKAGIHNQEASSRSVFGAEDVKRTLQTTSTDRQLYTPAANASSLNAIPRGPLVATSQTVSSLTKHNRAQHLARTLLSLCRCSRCKQPVLEPITLPCGHTSCLACIVLVTKARSRPSPSKILPCGTHLPPRLPISSTTVPCPSGECVRSAIGKGLGSWSGHNAVYGAQMEESAFDIQCSGEDNAGTVPVDGFVGPQNHENNRLVVIPAQERESFSAKYAISKYDLDSCLITQESGLLRPDVTLSKAVELLRQYSQMSHEVLSPTSSSRHRTVRYLETGNPSYRQSRFRQRQERRRRRARNALSNLIPHHPPGTRTPIHPHFHPALGLSEEGRESGAEGGIRALLDSSDDDDDEGDDQDFVEVEDDQFEVDGWSSGSHQDGSFRASAEDDQDDEIGGAYARQYTPMIQDTPDTKQEMKRTVTAYGSSSLSLTPETLHSELLDILECQLCYMLLYQPLTTPCGHTFCRNCFARSLDHSSTCPLCRSDMPRFSFFQEHPNNQLILSLLTSEWEDEEEDGGVTTAMLNPADGPKDLSLKPLYQERQITMEREARESLLSTPLFVLTLAFPHMPTILHIFEPRYRLMIRRCLESGQARFGMVMHSQDTPGPVPGMSRYGTMLEIKTVQMLPDGRSMIETVGSYRFRVLERGSLDGYTVGQIERVDDVSLEAEDQLESASLGVIDSNASSETMAEAREAQAAFRAAIGLDFSRGENQTLQDDGLYESFGQKTMTELVEICMSFIEKIRSGSAPWLITRLKNTYGPMPDATDVAAFGYWMALVMPIDENEKSKLLPIRSPRLRLRIVVHWIEQLQQTWWFNHGCSVQ